MFVIDTRSKLPIFEQLKKQILEFISIGVLSANEQLPSVRTLATQIGVNPNTVSKAYQELEAQGYVYTEKGKGCFIVDNGIELLIKEEKLRAFEDIVIEMKQHHITESELQFVVHQVYEEGIEHA